MKLFVTAVNNGNFSIVSEWRDNPQMAKMAFHASARTLWSDVKVTEAMVKILDEQMNTFEGYAEYISHSVVNGYLHDGKFYANYNEETEEYTDEIAGRTDSLYVDIPTSKKYKWDGEKFVEV